MRLELFHLERFQSTWEHVVKYNLAESGVQPLTLSELLNIVGESERMMRLPLGYVYTNGSPDLRHNISTLYRGSDQENVLVTNGSSEANFLAISSIVERGDEVLVMLPNYMQIWGLGKMLGAKTEAFMLRENEAWTLDLDEVNEKVSRRTKLIALCNPNNPTGAVLDNSALKGICEIARDAGAWVVSDEVYRGAELDGQLSPSVWGSYEKVIVTSGLSKAYALPGLRIGWIVTQKDLANSLWSYHDYTTICPSALSDYLAALALRTDNQSKIISRTRKILNENWPVLERWLKANSDIFKSVKPKAGAISFIRYNMSLNSTDLAEKLVREKSVLIAPGDHFSMDGYLRIAYGSSLSHLETALGLVSEFLESLSKTPK